MKTKTKTLLSKAIVFTLVLGILLSACQPDVLNEVEATNNDLMFSTSSIPTSDITSTLRDVTLHGIFEIEPAGLLLGGLATFLWPESEEDVWEEIREKVEALVDDKISDFNYKLVSEDLQGLKNVLDRYQMAEPDSGGSGQVKIDLFLNADDAFVEALPHFQSKDDQLTLLPLFAQFANLHLGLLREGALSGLDWGMSEADVQNIKLNLTSAIQEYSDYADIVYKDGLKDLTNKYPDYQKDVQQFNQVNPFIREMTLTVLDFREMWNYFDITQYPNGADVYLDRVIYSDAVGTVDHSSKFSLYDTPPTQLISTIEVWGWDRIDAIKVTYPAGGGPDGITATPRMGDSSGGSSEPPHGGVFDLSSSSGPVVEVTARTGDILNALFFKFADGSVSNKLGGNYPGGSDKVFSYPGHNLASVKVMGVSQFYKSADCAVFGFQLEKNQNVSSL
ncbi:insecticidal delta-endotoxin Cry8Ea1 family protein [Xanthovirga aplysinae]|uniref:insecticidal delta-endotoxin Cry8Ea1 family protein n=1 Tax=Xanthovirga aplysinae TaxID=2529853 RepID=UPI0012BC980B|nr:insecticidal delta-endotoxin Cry8Ea1 family protein [Xanthovirga aplysinae]MTI32416.1 hypothetical protein [Xanthovirga aplysinae]